LDGVLISSVNQNASETDKNGNLLEKITLNWARITWTIFLFDPRTGEPTGTLSHFFDRQSGQSG
jgi:hypothetical protein